MKLVIYSFAAVMAVSGSAMAQSRGVVRDANKGGAKRVETESLAARFEKGLRESKGTKIGLINARDVESKFTSAEHKAKAESLLATISGARTAVEADLAIMDLSMSLIKLTEAEKNAPQGSTKQAREAAKLPDVAEFIKKADLTLNNGSSAAGQQAVLEVLVIAEQAMRSGKSAKEALVEAIVEYRNSKNLGKFEGDLTKAVEDCFGA